MPCFTCDIHAIHSSVDGYLGCFHLLATANSAAMNMGVQIYFQDPAFNSFGYISRSGISGSWANSIFNFLRNCPPIFHSGCTTFPPTVHRVLISPILTSTCYYLHFFFFLVVAIPMGVSVSSPFRTPKISCNLKHDVVSLGSCCLLFTPRSCHHFPSSFKFIYLFIFGCVGSSFLREGFL